jgi:hypothetical protein
VFDSHLNRNDMQHNNPAATVDAQYCAASLGVCPVNSTLRWFPGDNRPPVTEVLSFRLPTQAAIQRFDEATIRFEMRFPRERWSAKIAIEKFRLIPRGL